MSFSRGLANVVTLGATAKVDAAAKSYKSTVAKYEEYRNLGNNIKNLQKKVYQIKSELDKKESTIKKIYSNPKTRERLSSVEEKAFREYKNCTNNLSSVPKFAPNAIGYWDWEDSVAENLSMIIATTVIPVGGVIGAHSSADAKVKEIQSKEQEVLKAIKKIQPQVIQMTRIKEQYETAIEILSTVKSVIERF